MHRKLFPSICFTVVAVYKHSVSFFRAEKHFKIMGFYAWRIKDDFNCTALLWKWKSEDGDWRE